MNWTHTQAFEVYQQCAVAYDCTYVAVSQSPVSSHFQMKAIAVFLEKKICFQVVEWSVTSLELFKRSSTKDLSSYWATVLFHSLRPTWYRADWYSFSVEKYNKKFKSGDNSAVIEILVNG